MVDKYILAIQVDYLDGILIFNVKLDLFLVCVFLISLYKGIFYGEISGFVFGLIENSMSGCILGTNALSKTLVGYFVNVFKIFSNKKITS
ncbi:MAG: hypothetical protein QMD92_04835 [bacterium]|nr:hypothetical protein [bacterium]